MINNELHSKALKLARASKSINSYDSDLTDSMLGNDQDVPVADTAQQAANAFVRDAALNVADAKDITFNESKSNEQAARFLLS